MADLSKVRVQVLDPETGSVIENVDVKTSDGAVYLPDGTTLRNWINNSEAVSALIQQTLAAHTTMKHVDAEKVDGVITGFEFTNNKIKATNHKGDVTEVDLGAVAAIDESITNKINELDSTKEQAASDTNPLALKIVQTDGKIESIEGSIAAETFDAYGAAKAVQGETTETVASVDAKVTALETSSEISVEKLATATEGYLSSYVIKQGGTQVGATIDIPKDYLVKKSNLVSFADDPDNVGQYLKTVVGEAVPTSVDALPAGVEVGKEYVEFVVNTVDDDGNESTMYLDVTKLIDVYTGSVGTEVTVAVVDNVVSASLVDGGISTAKLADGAVTNGKIADATITRAKIDAAFEQNISDAEDAIAALEDDVDAKVTLDDAPADLKLTSSASTNFITLSSYNTPYETTLITSVGKDETVSGVSVTPTVFSGEGADITSEFTLAYQWYKKVIGTDSAFVAIVGATSSTLDASNIDTSTVATTSYHVVVTATHKTDASIEVDPVVSRDVTVTVTAD